MPNYVQNIVKFSGEQNKLDAFFQNVMKMSDESDDFDFNKIISITPMPASLNIENGSRTDIAREYFAAKIKNENVNKRKDVDIQEIIDVVEAIHKTDDDRKSLLELGEKAYSNFELYGATDWCDWCLHNWGTKWNAMNCVLDKNINTVYFQTVWLYPWRIVEKLPELYPDIEFEWTWADEDCVRNGRNAGTITFKDGELTISSAKPRSNEVYRLYVYCWGEQDFLEVDQDGNYRVISE